MKVSLLAYTQPSISQRMVTNSSFVDMEQLLAAEKRICNTADSLNDILKEQTADDARKRIESALKDKHFGMFEHISFTFLIEDVSRNMTHQLVRHRMASYLQQSQRSVDMNCVDIVIPPSIPDGSRELFKLQQDMSLVLYNHLVGIGVPKDDARYIMPHGDTTTIIMTINARALMHFLKLRLAEHAQWEIKIVAKLMLRLVQEHFPTVFDERWRDSWE